MVCFVVLGDFGGPGGGFDGPGGSLNGRFDQGFGEGKTINTVYSTTLPKENTFTTTKNL